MVTFCGSSVVFLVQPPLSGFRFLPADSSAVRSDFLRLQDIKHLNTPFRESVRGREYRFVFGLFFTSVLHSVAKSRFQSFFRSVHCLVVIDYAGKYRPFFRVLRAFRGKQCRLFSSLLFTCLSVSCQALLLRYDNAKNALGFRRNR